MKSLIDQQKELERDGLDLGVSNYRKALQKAREKGIGFESLPPGIQLLKRTLDPVQARIEEWKKDVTEGKATRSAGMIKFIDQFSTETVAMVTMRALIGMCGLSDERMTLTRVAFAISITLENVLNYDHLKKEKPGLHRRLEEKLRKATDSYKPVLIRRAKRYAQTEYGIETIKWSDSERERLGVHLIEIAVDATGMFERRLVRESGKRTVYQVQPTPALREWITEANARSELLQPVMLPMIVPPRPWSGPRNGGYYLTALRNTFVRTHNVTYLDELENADLSPVLEAVNAIQDTQWRVNKGVLAVAREVWDMGGGMAGLPVKDEIPLPPKTHDESLPGNHPDVVRWRKTAAAVHDENRKMGSQRVAVSMALYIAEKFQHYENIYFPHNLDWRGRVYPISQTLNPQGDDFARGLLEFGEGGELGETGAYWLAVHGANCYGVDKVSFDDRVQWVIDHEDEILDSAMQPLTGRRFWMETEDNPWQFLAFCQEWLSLRLHLSSGGEQATFVSHLPVGMDGSCNGIQHYAALMRDEQSARAVSMVPMDSPADIYALVASEAQRLIDIEAAEGSEIAQFWVGKMNRKLSKRNTMTVPYSVTKFGMVRQVEAEMKKHKLEARNYDLYGRPDYSEDAVYIAGKNYDAISTVVVAARRAQDWLKEAAEVVADDGLPVRWVTPVGFPVLQSYRKPKGRYVDFKVFGKRIKLLISQADGPIDVPAMALGIAPNFIHSLDGAALVRTVLYCKDAGIKSFGMIHDSYATHAGQIDLLNRELRHAFIEQYEEPVFENFRQQLIDQLTPELAEKIPPLPPLGDFDVRAVMDADYFFA